MTQLRGVVGVLRPGEPEASSRGVGTATGSSEPVVPDSTAPAQQAGGSGQRLRVPVFVAHLVGASEGVGFVAVPAPHEVQARCLTFCPNSRAAAIPEAVCAAGVGTVAAPTFDGHFCAQHDVAE